MEAGVILLCLGLVFLTGSAVMAFAWAARTGQFENLEAAPEVIFDAAEPAGEAGDCFPDARSHAAMASANREEAVVSGGPAEGAGRRDA